MDPATADLPESRSREAILEAAEGLFLHYGFRRTSLEEIAREAGLSRTAIYHHFRNKEAILLAIAERLYAGALDTAAAAACAPLPLHERLRRVLEAKLGYFFELLHGSRHGADLMDLQHQICGDLIQTNTCQYTSILASMLGDADRAGDIDLARHGLTAEAAADLLYLAARGLQDSTGLPISPEEYHRRLDKLVGTALGGWAPPASRDASLRPRPSRT